MTLTTINSPALVSGTNLSNKNIGETMAERVKLICTSELPYAVKTDSVQYGDVFEEEGQVVRELIGSGKAIKYSEEAMKKIKEQLATQKKK